jgi:hypothetical protein
MGLQGRRRVIEEFTSVHAIRSYVEFATHL